MEEGILTYGEGIARWFRVLSKGWEGGMMCPKDEDKHNKKQTQKNLKGNNIELNFKTNKNLIRVATFSLKKP